MDRTIRAAALIALGAIAALAAPVPAYAVPTPGSVTATFTDVCGFVRAVFTNDDPGTARAAYVRVSRNGKLIESGSQVKGVSPVTLFQVAAAGDQFHYEWDVTGGTTESLDYTHATPGGCAEPRLAVSLIDSCGADFTVSVTNSGSGPADVLITAPTLRRAPYTVPAGGAVKVTVPGVSTSGAWVGRYRPDAVGDAAKAVIVDAKQRAAGCGIPWPNDQLVTFTRTCDTASFLLYALDMKSTVVVRRNGTVVLEQPVDHDIYKLAVTVQPNDVVTIGDAPQLLKYTHVPPTGCLPAVAPAGLPPGAAPSAGSGPSALPGASGTQLATPDPLVTSNDGAWPAAAGPPRAGGTHETDGARIAMITVVSAIGVLVVAFVGWLLIGLVRRRRSVWAVAFGAAPPRLAIQDVGVIPTSSLRWVAYTGSTANYLREDVEP